MSVTFSTLCNKGASAIAILGSVGWGVGGRGREEIRMSLYVCIILNYRKYETFLANDVTLVTSYGYCQSLKINDILHVCLWCLSYTLWGWGIFCETVGRGVHPGHWNSYLISGTYPYSLYYGSTSPGLWSVLHWQVSINRNYLIFLRMCCFVYLRSGRVLFTL